MLNFLEKTRNDRHENSGHSTPGMTATRATLCQIRELSARILRQSLVTPVLLIQSTFTIHDHIGLYAILNG